MNTAALESLKQLICGIIEKGSSINLAEYIFTSNTLTLYLEDKSNPVEWLDDSVIVELEKDFVEKLVLKEYDVEGDAFEWFKEDASAFEREYLLNFITAYLVSSVKNSVKLAA